MHGVPLQLWFPDDVDKIAVGDKRIGHNRDPFSQASKPDDTIARAKFGLPSHDFPWSHES